MWEYKQRPSHDGLPWTSKETDSLNNGKKALREAVTNLRHAVIYLESHMLRDQIAQKKAELEYILEEIVIEGNKE